MLHVTGQTRGYVTCSIWPIVELTLILELVCCLRDLGDVRVTVEVTLRIIQAVLLTCSWYKKMQHGPSELL